MEKGSLNKLDGFIKNLKKLRIQKRQIVFFTEGNKLYKKIMIKIRNNWKYDYLNP